MSQVVEADAQGGLHLPPELLHDVKPHTRFLLEVRGDTLILRPEKPQPFWATATPEERAETFRQWASAVRPPAPVLPLEALSRDSIYE